MSISFSVQTIAADKFEFESHELDAYVKLVLLTAVVCKLEFEQILCLINDTNFIKLSFECKNSCNQFHMYMPPVDQTWISGKYDTSRKSILKLYNRQKFTISSSSFFDGDVENLP